MQEMNLSQLGTFSFLSLNGFNKFVTVKVESIFWHFQLPPLRTAPFPTNLPSELFVQKCGQILLTHLLQFCLTVLCSGLEASNNIE